MKKFKMNIFETITHTYETEAENEVEAFEKIEKVYLEGEDELMAKKINTEPLSNEYGDVEEVKR